jgi:NDP-sugar pyrophosphorylase family protein
MHIVIPMSGIGKRFLDADYTDPKPLIQVEGRPIIAHVVDMFPGETKFTFICNEEHLKNTKMREVLTKLVPNANIISIEPHKKGPVYAVSKIYDLIGDEEEVIVNYCDFGKNWDYDAFLKDIRSNKADGAISAYRGFHPHMLGTINYAFMREKENWMLEIQEKKPFTENRMAEYASDGTYYFRTGAILKKYFNLTMKEDISVNGEYYVSVVYNLLLRDSLKVRIFEIKHMLQWGTPGELEEYLYWSEIFKELATMENSSETNEWSNALNLIPMAGKGSRFADQGYKIPKPLLPINNEPMVVLAAKSLPVSKKYVFVCQNEHLNKYPIELELKKAFSDVKIVGLDKVTEGQAITASLGLEGEDRQRPLFIAASDNDMVYDRNDLKSHLETYKPDVVVFTFSGNPSSAKNPKMYGWVKHDGVNVESVSVKIPISNNPKGDDAIVGAFYFKSIQLFESILEELIKRNIRINNEFYIDSMVGLAKEMGHSVTFYRIKKYICWGTPDDYNTFLYWQTFFKQDT